ncbi:MAG TPA: hypothetical protein V6D22_16335 [Candidatus Obscuribacterales bacterium]
MSILYLHIGLQTDLIDVLSIRRQVVRYCRPQFGDLLFLVSVFLGRVPRLAHRYEMSPKLMSSSDRCGFKKSSFHGKYWHQRQIPKPHGITKNGDKS